MEEKSLANLLSQLIPDDLEKSLGLGGDQSGQEAANLAGSLRSIAGQAGGPLEGAINEFLGGQGELHEATRAAASSGTAGLKSIVDMLVSRFKLSPAIANLVAPILLKLIPALAGQAKETEKETTKPKPKPRKKPKTASSSKKETASGKKKPKKESAARPKPKPAATKPAARPKPKPKPKTTKKKTASKPKPKPKPKTAKRTGTYDIDDIDIG